MNRFRRRGVHARTQVVVHATVADRDIGAARRLPADGTSQERARGARRESANLEQGLRAAIYANFRDSHER